MATVSSYEAKTHLPGLLRRVMAGEAITITRHGAPVAMLVPVSGQPRPDLQAVIQAMQDFRKGRKLAGLSVREMIEAGRR